MRLFIQSLEIRAEAATEIPSLYFAKFRPHSRFFAQAAPSHLFKLVGLVQRLQNLFYYRLGRESIKITSPESLSLPPASSPTGITSAPVGNVSKDTSGNGLFGDLRAIHSRVEEPLAAIPTIRVVVACMKFLRTFLQRWARICMVD